jgi:hypothetical protein
MQSIKSRSLIFGVLLMVILTASMASAQTALNARVVFRPLTPGEISTYKLPSTTETAGGFTNVGLGQPAYLEADINIAVPASDIVGVTWTLTSKPAGSNAAIAASPLPAALPVFEPSDALLYQVAGRALLRPDLEGEYAVTAVITTKSNGSATVQQSVFGAKYMGISTCKGCHDGQYAPLNKVATWQTTAHASIFTNNINGTTGQTTYSTSCYSCHTVGEDANATANNGGFYNVWQQLGWTPPSATAPTNWASVPAALQNLANIQCENCHGAGSLHANSGGTPFEITVAPQTGGCQQCHDAPTHHVKGTEWKASMHAVTTTDPAGNATCIGCHTKNGFIARMSGTTTTDTSYGAINCQTCHEPHGETTPSTAAHLIRNDAPLALADGTKITNAGEGALCMECHQARQAAKTYVPATAGSAHFGPHEGPQADMLTGANGFTYGEQIPTSAHQFVVQDTCVTCHMQTVATTDKVFLQAGGHTFKMSATPAGATAPEQLVAPCQTCHGPDVTTFNFPLFDYDGDGVIDGCQTEVQHLLDKLSAMLPPVGQPKTALTIDATWTKPQLEAAYNWLFVTNDGSKGVHNMAYTVGLLKASIENLQAGK